MTGVLPCAGQVWQVLPEWVCQNVCRCNIVLSTVVLGLNPIYVRNSCLLTNLSISFIGKGPKAAAKRENKAAMEKSKTAIASEGKKGHELGSTEATCRSSGSALRLALSASALDPNSSAAEPTPPAPPPDPKVAVPSKSGKPLPAQAIKKSSPVKIPESSSEESDSSDDSDESSDSEESSSSEESSDDEQSSSEASSDDDKNDQVSNDSDESSSSDSEADSSDESSSSDESDTSSSESEDDNDNNDNKHQDKVVNAGSSGGVGTGVSHQPPSRALPSYPPPPQPAPLRTPWSNLPQASVAPAWRFDALEPFPSVRDLAAGDVIAYRLLEVGPSMCPQVMLQFRSLIYS